MMCVTFSNFDDNDSLGRGGVLSTAYVPIYFGGTVNFRRNIGRSLAVSVLPSHHIFKPFMCACRLLVQE